MVLKTKDINALMDAVREAGYRQLRVQSPDFLFEIDQMADAALSPVDTIVEHNPASLREIKPTERDGLVSIVAPMSGTFYRAPDPEAAAFVEVGSKVTSADVVCIVEVMKLFSSIRAGCNGEIVEICPKNAASVGSGEALFWIKPLEDDN